MLKKKWHNKLTATRTIAIGFLGIILAGTVLLALPIASADGKAVDLLTALFTATSATCVTGLVVVDTYSGWSAFGKTVLLTLIQIGGLGFMTIGVFVAVLMKKNIGLKERGILQESMNMLQIGGIVRLVKKITIGTLLIEGIGAVLLSIRFIPQMGWIRGIGNGIFHSISAFCNAGFDLMGKTEEYSSLVSYSGDVLVNITIMALIVTGGIGFLVWDDLQKKKLRFKEYLLHTKIVLVVTASLLFGGALLIYLFERNHLMADMGAGEKVLTSLFASVTARTAGFNTIDVGGMSASSKLVTIVLMFIGGSPGSTAGGIKTTTFAVMLIFVWANLRNSHGSNIFGRRLEEEEIRKASIVVTINLLLAVAAAVILCGMQSFPMEDVLLEVFSAIGTVGMSSGITRQLNTVARVIIIFLMYCGRIGSMTFALSFTERKKVAPVQLPAEKIIIG
ncbi:MAG: Trk family potassium uptake protein [Lachnospiraceae bacterium]|jgi:trk system potassium uptake protein TrkH|nr:Trk family potassium uptake protein [Lachnospiraceae bacterium]